jgi:multidrug efflux system outer membrane protein
VDAPTQYRDQRITENASLADLPWWEVFRDERLRELIQTGLVNNYDLRVAIQRIEQARQIQLQARAEFFPTVNYQAGLGQGKNAVFGSPAGFGIPQQSQIIGALNAAWEPDLWGRIRRSNEAALAQYLANQEARRGILLGLTSDIAQAYYELLGLDLLIEISHKNRDSFTRSLDIFQQRFDGGIVSRLEVARAQAALANVAATIPELERQVILKENQINVLLGRNPGPIERTTTLLQAYQPPQVPPGVPSALLERRPDIRQAEQNVREANARIGIAQAAFFPQIGLTALFGRMSIPLEDIVLGKSNLWFAGASAAGPIFQGGRLKAQKREAVAFWEETQLRYQQTALTAFREVANALASREKFEQVRVEQFKAVQAFEVSVDIAMQRYLAGRASYFEVLEAQQLLFPAESALAQTQINQRTIIVQLYRALGGGWQVSDQDWTGPRAPGAAPPKP